MTYGEYFLYFSAGAFWGVMAWANIKNLIRRYKAKRGKSNLDNLIAKLRKEAEEAIRNSMINTKSNDEVETTVMSWRYKGKMQEVKIIIDPALDNVSSEEDFEELVKRGDAGKLQELMDGKVPQDTKDKIADQEAFVFSRKSVESMKMVGLTPDEVVTKILKASGRMD